MAGAVAGVTGSGKGKGQKIRDAWREGVQNAGIFESRDGKHFTELADGTVIDIGGKKINSDGTERESFDIDWSNPTQVNTIPDAHIFAIATGLNPNEGEADIFHRATGIALNAASSNASNEQEVRDNFRAMLGKANVDPRQVAFQIETLRQTNKISEQEYGVYLDRVNKIFGAQVTPTNRAEARQFMLQNLQSVP